ncbi:hypothetical protein LX64_01472 [Chitinophaga skermanii]|uniref:Uncharacterized protein n=1 Tax=Chitinophaga skermanii TaxID=331697 RepID=A0A327QYI1_9BACT|nr:hypothetical protein LX64_01472 [Chitinophaga skermanii]
MSLLTMVAIVVATVIHLHAQDTKREQTIIISPESVSFIHKNHFALLKPSGDGVTSYTIPVVDHGPVDPVLDPIICDGMTASQLYDDMIAKWQAYKLTAEYAAKLAVANATCQVQLVCIGNCGMAGTFFIEPTRLACRFNWVQAVKANDKFTVL